MRDIPTEPLFDNALRRHVTIPTPFDVQPQTPQTPQRYPCGDSAQAFTIAAGDPGAARARRENASAKYSSSVRSSSEQTC